jgi:hypothetical protein
MTTPDEQRTQVKTWLAKAKVDPDVLSQTLNVDADHISPQLLLKASQKLIKINKLETEPDNRDDLQYANFLGLEDFVKEHIEKDAGKIQMKAKGKMQQKKDLSWLHAGFFSPQIRSIVIGGSNLAQHIEGHNPIDSYDISQKVTKLGAGGIPCFSDDTEVLTLQGWKLWPNVVAEDKLAANVDGKLKFRTPDKLYSNWYTGVMYGLETMAIDYLVTPNHRLFTMKRSDVAPIDRFWVEYAYETAENAHNKKRRHKLALDSKPIDTEVEASPIIILAGYFLLTGRIFNRNSRVSIEKTPKNVEPVIAALKKLNVEFIEHTDKIDFFDRSIWLAFKSMGKFKNRHFNAYLRRANKRDKYELLQILADPPNEKGVIVFKSASRQLTEDVGFLALVLGYNVIYDTKERFKLTKYFVHIRDRKEVPVRYFTPTQTPYYLKQYDGRVYCASIEGGMLLTRRNGKTFWSGNSVEAIPDESRAVNSTYFGFFDPFRISETHTVGVDHRFANNVVKGRNNKLYRLVYDKNMKPTWVDHETLLKSNVHIPNH